MNNWRQIWDPKNPKIKSSQNQNPFCPNCRRDFFMPEKSVPAPFGALPAHFFRGPEKSKKCTNFAYFPWWAHGPYSPGLGPLLLSTRGGATGRIWGPSVNAFMSLTLSSGSNLWGSLRLDFAMQPLAHQGK